MITRVEPSRTSDERTMLTAMLDYYRATLALKASGLTDAQVRAAAVPPSDLSLLGLVRHMAEVERNWFRHGFANLDVAPLYYGDSHPTGDEDGDLHPGAADTLDDAMAAWDSEIAFARELTAGASLDQLAGRVGRRGPFTLRWVLVHLIEEYARHCGHADLIRERLDGAVGD